MALMLQTILCAFDLIFVNNCFDHCWVVQTDGIQMHTVLYTVFALERTQNICKGYVSLASLLFSSIFSFPFM